MLLPIWHYVPKVTGSDGSPSPSTLVANTVTLMSVVWGQDDEEILNMWLQTLPLQEELKMLVELHTSPNMESE